MATSAIIIGGVRVRVSARSHAADKPSGEVYTLFRYCMEHDKLVMEWALALGLERFLVGAGLSLFRPTDAVMRAQLAKAEALKKRGKSPDESFDDPEFKLVQMEGYAYCVKGVISPDNMRPRHVWVTMANRAYAIYLDGNGPDIYICDELTDDAAAQKKCTRGKHLVTAQNGSNIYALPGPISHGFTPLEHPPRITIQHAAAEAESVGADGLMVGGKRGKTGKKPKSGKRGPKRLPKLRKRSRRAMYGGGRSDDVRPCDCELLGGARGDDAVGYEPGSRAAIKREFEAVYGRSWSKKLVRQLFAHLSASSAASAESTVMAETMSALMTGNHQVDAERFLEYNADRGGDREVLNLLPDPVLHEFYASWAADRAGVEMAAKPWKRRFNAVLLGGTRKPFTQVRRKRYDALQAFVRESAGVAREAAEADYASEACEAVEGRIEKTLGMIDGMYEEIASKNALSAGTAGAAESASAFSPTTHAYLRSRFGKKLGHYLAHAALRFAYNEEMDSDGMTVAEKEDYLQTALPGRDHREEFVAALGASAGTNPVPRIGLLGRAVVGGHFPYLRASMESFENGAMVGGGAGGAGVCVYGAIETAYRPFEADDGLSDDEPGDGVAGVMVGGAKRGTRGKRVGKKPESAKRAAKKHLKKRLARVRRADGDIDIDVASASSDDDDDVSGRHVPLRYRELADAAGPMGAVVRKAAKRLRKAAVKARKAKRVIKKAKRRTNPAHRAEHEQRRADPMYVAKKAAKKAARHVARTLKKATKRVARKKRMEADAEYAQRRAAKKAKRAAKPQRAAKKAKKTVRHAARKSTRKTKAWYAAYSAEKAKSAEYQAYRAKKAKRAAKKATKRATKPVKHVARRRADGTEEDESEKESGPAPTSPTAPAPTPAPKPEPEAQRPTPTPGPEKQARSKSSMSDLLG